MARTAHRLGLRPKPADFREQYILQGWETIVWHYNTSWQCVKRWIDEEGRDELKAARRAHVRKVGNQSLNCVRHVRRSPSAREKPSGK